ncbi:MAG: response regulator [Phycisphaera sp.]|nr:response regulator [Phycisphaera sp.]
MTSNRNEPEKLSRPRLLVVEDEQDLLDLLRYNLERDGYEVVTAVNGERALKLARAEHFDLILLDLMLPGTDGLSVCRSLKNDGETRNTPVVMLTAKGEEADIVLGLELGADDYITKPFSPRVLIARIKAVLRRPNTTLDDDSESGAQTLHYEGLTVHRDRHQVLIADEEVQLTATEFRLLCLLLSKPGRVFTRQQIIEAIHGRLAAVTDRSVDVQVVALRRKLLDKGDMIQTVRGVGYRLKD